MSWNPIYGLLLLGIIAATYLSAVIIEDIQMKETIINRSIMAASVGMGAEVRWNVMPQEKIPWLEEEKAEVFQPESINLDRLI